MYVQVACTVVDQIHRDKTIGMPPCSFYKAILMIAPFVHCFMIAFIDKNAHFNKSAPMWALDPY